MYQAYAIHTFESSVKNFQLIGKVYFTLGNFLNEFSVFSSRVMGSEINTPSSVIARKKMETHSIYGRPEKGSNLLHVVHSSTFVDYGKKSHPLY